jgi:predicted small metal-binding protein
MKTVTCREAGFDCDHVVEGETEDEVLNRGVEHLVKDHGMKEEQIHSWYERESKKTYSHFLNF